MNTDPVKNVGKIQEQIEMEYKSRRNYPRKWSKFCEETPWKKMYNQNEINKQIKMDINIKDHKQDIYSNAADLCRCGRSRLDLHLLKCLQKRENNYSTNSENTSDATTNKLPETSSGFVGWHRQQPGYKQWEKSMKYISPMYDMPGKKLTETSYNTIIIG